LVGNKMLTFINSRLWVINCCLAII
jgi:hypothetical protein